MSSTWSSGESSPPIAAARPPCAQKLELSLSGLREHHRRRASPLGRGQRRVEAGGAPADHHDVEGSSGVIGAGGPSLGCYGIRAWPLPPTSELASSTTPAAHPENARRLTAIEEAMSERDWLGLELVEAPAAEPRAARARPQRRPRRLDRGALRRRAAGMIDIDTRRQRRLLGGGPARGRRRGRTRPSGCWRRRRRSPSAACARRATTPSATGRWASACSTTSRSPPRTRSRSAAPSGSWCSTGTSTTATAPRRSSTAPRRVLYSSIHQSPLYPGHRRRRRTSAAARGRATRSTCRSRPARAR